MSRSKDHNKWIQSWNIAAQPLVSVIESLLYSSYFWCAGNGKRQRLVKSPEAGEPPERRTTASRWRAVERASDSAGREPAPRCRADSYPSCRQGPWRQDRRARSREQTTFGSVSQPSDVHQLLLPLAPTFLFLSRAKVRSGAKSQPTNDLVNIRVKKSSSMVAVFVGFSENKMQFSAQKQAYWLQTANHDINDIYCSEFTVKQTRNLVGPISHRSAPYEEFSHGAVATIALWNSAPMAFTMQCFI